MTLAELTELALTVCRAHCAKVADLQYYGSEGPFIVAMDEQGGEPKFFCFSLAATDEFLAQPAELPLALDSDDFPFAMLASFDLAHLDNTYKYYPFTYNKIVPDEPACRRAVQKLWHTEARAASLISLLSPEGVLIPAHAIRDSQTLLS